MEIRWELLDDRSFVTLVADLLRRLGFVDVQLHGDGPDGGLDLIATELVPFAFQGARPLKWGIQCKFSKPGGRRAVNDSEIRDVEGTLRSKRYLDYRLQGYMLITNRRVGQTVAERLLGIDNSSRFRATWLDSSILSQRLAGMPDLLNLYFGRLIKQIEDLTAEQTQERSGEQAGGGLLFSLKRDPCSDISLPRDSADLTGVFEGESGTLELEHSYPDSSVYGKYTYNSEEFVAELAGNLERGVLLYHFQWFDRDIRGMGFHLVSKDSDHLEGVWLSTNDLLGMSLAMVLENGNRNWYRRVA